MCVWRIAHGLRAEDPAVAPAVRAALGTARGGGVDVLASVKPPVPRARAVVVCMRLRPAHARRLLPAVAVVAKRIDGLAGGGGGGGLGSLDRLRPTLLSQATTLAVSAGENDCQHDRHDSCAKRARLFREELANASSEYQLPRIVPAVRDGERCGNAFTHCSRIIILASTRLQCFHRFSVPRLRETEEKYNV